MADNRKINNAVRIGDETYGPGREDELAAVLTKDQLKRLTDDGALEGDFKASGQAQAEKAAAPNQAKK